MRALTWSQKFAAVFGSCVFLFLLYWQVWAEDSAAPQPGNPDKFVGTYYLESGPAGSPPGKMLISLHGDGTITSRSASMFDTDGGGFMGRRSTPAGGSWNMTGGNKVLVTLLLFQTGMEPTNKDVFNSAGGNPATDGLITRISYLAEFDQLVQGRYQMFATLNWHLELFFANSNPILDEPFAVIPGESGVGLRLETSSLPLTE